MRVKENKELSIKTTLKLLKILYVEDEELIRKNITKILSFLCYNIISVKSAEEAMQIYSSFNPDIVICDIKLPNMNGIEFVKWIRSNNNKAQVFLLTAYTETQYLLEAIKLNLVAYLIKPINFEILKENLEIATENIINNKTLTIKFISGAIYSVQEKSSRYNNETHSLTATEIKLLIYLITNKIRRISKEELKLNLWGKISDNDGKLKTLISKLRLKVGKESIENISGVGYKIVLIKD